MENLNENLGKFSLSNESTTTTYKHDGQSKSDASTVSSNANNKSISSFKASAHTTCWLEALQIQHHQQLQQRHRNNNNELREVSGDSSHCDSVDCGQTKLSAAWHFSSCDIHKISYPLKFNEKDEGGGGDGKRDYDDHAVENNPLTFNGSKVIQNTMELSHSDIDVADLCGAVSLTPPVPWEDQCGSESAAAAVAAGGISNRTSLNNSTENLSYISDSFYADDVLILGEDRDVEAEELSLNSDDCIYAYRGGAADFDLPLEPLDGRLCSLGGEPLNNCVEDEMDFLEMDFEPDPLSELEFNHTNSSSINTNATLGVNVTTSNSRIIPKTQYNQRQQLFSSPVNDMPPPTKGLQQTQSMLSKNFARITLHLDQIQQDYTKVDKERKMNNISAMCYQRDKLEFESVPDKSLMRSSKHNQFNTAAHSLPNTLHEHFGNRSVSESAMIMSPNECSITPPLNALMQNNSLHTMNDNKITGAKPKRLSTTFSSTSSTSSKNSSKSRHSLRSTQQPMTSLCSNNNEFDERSVSCSEFRTERERDLLSTHTTNNNTTSTIASTIAGISVTTDTILTTSDCNSSAEDACLDCLEKEFLISTIGNSSDTQYCVKCPKHLNNFLQYQRNLLMKQSPLQASTHALAHTQISTQSQSHFKRNMSNACNAYFLNNEQYSPSTSRIFSSEYFNTQARRREEWDSYLPDSNWNDYIFISQANTKHSSKIAQTSTQQQQIYHKQLTNLNYEVDTPLKDKDTHEQNIIKGFQDIPAASFITISTKNLTDVQALEKALNELGVAYNKEFLHKHFNKCFSNSLYSINTTKSHTNTASSTIMMTPKTSYTKNDSHTDLLHFLLHVSKSTGNYGKLKRLIHKITHSQVTLQYKKDASIGTSNTEMVKVIVNDILYYWSLCKNLEQLKQLDQRFTDNNVLGKIANIIRQSYQRGPARRPLPEFIYIPQYYPTGYLTLIKKC